MVNEDDRSRLVAALENTSAALEQSIAARKKLEEKYSAIKSNVKRMAKQYEVLHSKVELTQKQKQDISSSFEMAQNKSVYCPARESRAVPAPELVSPYQPASGKEQDKAHTVHKKCLSYDCRDIW